MFRTRVFTPCRALWCRRIWTRGLSVLLEGHPLGPLRPNTVLMGWSSDPERSSYFVHHLNTVRRLGMSIILLEDKDLSHDSLHRRIDVWWRGEENGYLMILIAHLLTLNWEWSRSRIRLLRLMKEEAGRGAVAGSSPATDPSRPHGRGGGNHRLGRPSAQGAGTPFRGRLSRHPGFQGPRREGAGCVQVPNALQRILSGLPATLLVCSSGEAGCAGIGQLAGSRGARKGNSVSNPTYL